MYTISVKSLPRFHTARPKDEDLKFLDGKGPPERYIGVEIECDGFKHSAPIYPEVFDDLPDSVREMRDVVRKYGGGFQNDRDFEIQTAPARGDSFRKQIKDICAALSKAKAYQTAGCGLHVHIDMRDLTPGQLRKVLLGYGVVEMPMLRTVPLSRARNKYCQPLGDFAFHRLMKIPKGELAKTVNGKLTAGAGIHGNDARYLALNLFAYNAHKTFEIRTHEATMDPEEIINWSCAWAEFVDRAKDMPTSKIISLKDTIKGYNEFFSADTREYLRERALKFADEWKSSLGVNYPSYRQSTGTSLIARFGK